MVSDTLSVGILGRLSKATAKIYNMNFDSGGTHLNVFVAYHFGKTGNRSIVPMQQPVPAQAVPTEKGGLRNDEMQ